MKLLREDTDMNQAITTGRVQGCQRESSLGEGEWNLGFSDVFRQ